MLMQIHNASPLAVARIVASGQEFKPEAIPAPDLQASIASKEKLYPFRALQVGHCFIEEYPADTVARIALDRRLRTAAQRAGKVLDRKFTVISHRSQKVIEVARIA